MQSEPRFKNMRKVLPFGLVGLGLFATGYAMGNRGKPEPQQPHLPLDIDPPQWVEPDLPERDMFDEEPPRVVPGQLPLLDFDPADSLEALGQGPLLAALGSPKLGVGLGQGDL